MRRILLPVLVAVVAAMSCTVTLEAATATAASCGNVTIPVALNPGGARKYHIAATYCLPSHRRPSPGAPVDVLVPGATYDRSYWNWPQDDDRYSFLRMSSRAGRAALAIDRIGTGESSHPAPGSLTLASDAYTLHQVIGWLRDAGARRITVVGHSLGSGVAVVEAATYHDTDALVATGMLHAEGAGLSSALASFEPARLTPRFAGLDPGYVTTVPGARRADFYSASADPAVIARDEATKDVVSGTEFAGYGTLLAPPQQNVSRTVDVPVLEVVGEQDALMCGGTLDCADGAAVRANELPYYPAAPSLTTLVVPGTGHDLALHSSAPETFTDIERWICSH